MNQLSSERKTKPGVEILKNETDKESRFTEVVEQFVTNFVLDHENANTKRKTIGHLKLLKEYLEKNNETRPIHEVPAPDLNSILSRFFLSIHQNYVSEYEPTTL
ncbi:hypothetical protein ACJMK2_042999 [Sinanodonta woodiana]|uniref:Uncharacterized protein n=1 Tax=Sinanodonta woodiana TaxID=1069815 RepID=A0ABD3VYF7_SINWO